MKENDWLFKRAGEFTRISIKAKTFYWWWLGCPAEKYSSKKIGIQNQCYFSWSVSVPNQRQWSVVQFILWKKNESSKKGKHIWKFFLHVWYWVVEWWRWNKRAWMWSGASVAHRPSVREDLGSIPHPNPGWHFSEALISLLSDNRLKNDSFICNIVMSSWNK